MGFKVENPVLALGWCFNVCYNITIHISTCIAFVEITTQSWNSTTTISVYFRTVDVQYRLGVTDSLHFISLVNKSLQGSSKGSKDRLKRFQKTDEITLL